MVLVKFQILYSALKGNKFQKTCILKMECLFPTVTPFLILVVCLVQTYLFNCDTAFLLAPVNSIHESCELVVKRRAIDQPFREMQVSEYWLVTTESSQTMTRAYSGFKSLVPWLVQMDCCVIHSHSVPAVKPVPAQKTRMV